MLIKPEKDKVADIDPSGSEGVGSCYDNSTNHQMLYILMSWWYKTYYNTSIDPGGWTP